MLNAKCEMPVRPRGEPVLPNWRGSQARGSCIAQRKVLGLQRLHDPRPGPVKLGIQAERLLEMLQRLLVVSPVEQRPSLVRVRQRVLRIPGERGRDSAVRL